jgi:hypothetical protein
LLTPYQPVPIILSQFHPSSIFTASFCKTYCTN